MDKFSAFFVGNVVGLTILVGGVLLTSPKKLKETETLEKQELARKAQVLAKSARDSSKIQDSEAENLAPYVVATKNIAHGDKIGATSVKLEKLPWQGNQEALIDLGSVVGKTAISDIHAGNTITARVLKN
ncbi:hypothetical protein BH10CYA1_BH10CYA1_57670 [soil metagenome]